MKKILLLAGNLLFVCLVNAQVGINTSNPLGTFHIDGAKDNAATPTAAQAANDFIVTSSGNVGAGTINPTTKLHVNSSTSPAFRLVDGTQGAGKVLSSDANGNATWVTDNTSKPTVIAALGPGVTLTQADNPPSSGTPGNGRDTGTSVTIPANSKYIVMCYMLVRINPNAPADGYGWIQTTFTDSPASNTHSADIQGSWFISGAIIPNQIFNMMSGAIVINNTSASPKTYYYRVRIATANNLGNYSIESFGGAAWGENNIIAVGIN